MISPTNIEWDKAKAKANELKHGVSFIDAATSLGDLMSVTIDSTTPDEERFVNIGMDDNGRLLVVVYTYRGEIGIRIISARRATPNERRKYGG
ncbi:MAG: BrnT family toxin [Magnetococcus sp. DMHC-1]|nr:BrnT family toxin [Magnetococcales bacterium]